MRFVSATLLLVLAAGSDQPAGYHLVKTVPVPGDGGWDYVSVDAAGRRVYISHANKVDVLDADTFEVKGSIADTAGVHGIAVAPELNRGFTSNGRANTVTIFDLKTLKSEGVVQTGRNPDSIIYDPATKRVFAFNGGGKSTTVIDAAEGKVVATLDLGGQPEFAAADGKGHVFVNVEDKNEVLKLDAEKPAILEHWPLAPGATPTGMSMDRANRRLFVGCRNKMLIVVNADNGKVIDSLPINERVDATAYDPETKLVYASNGDGTVNIFRQETADKYVAEGVLKTRVGSKTMGLDLKSHRLFIPAAEFKAAASNTRGRPAMVTGSFVVLVYEK
jgi:DNA-binding beta-propeller fold protein YncE